MCFIQRKSLFKDKEETLKFNIPINNLFHFISFFFYLSPNIPNANY